MNEFGYAYCAPTLPLFMLSSSLFHDLTQSQSSRNSPRTTSSSLYLTQFRLSMNFLPQRLCPFITSPSPLSITSIYIEVNVFIPAWTMYLHDSNTCMLQTWQHFSDTEN